MLALNVVLTSCSRRARVVGTWQMKSGGLVMVFNSNGSFSSGGGVNHYTGTWQINGAILTLTLTNSTGPHPDGQIGETVHCKIIHVDSHRLSYMVGGQTVRLERFKN